MMGGPAGPKPGHGEWGAILPSRFETARDVTPKKYEPIPGGYMEQTQREARRQRRKFWTDTAWLYFSAFLIGWIGGAIWMLWKLSLLY